MGQEVNGYWLLVNGEGTSDVYLNVGSGSHGVQTARIIERYEAHLLKNHPIATVVFGDVNSTAACALAAVKLGIPVVHVEAGLRSSDRSMPEEINRIVTDALSDLLFVSEPSGVENLNREGVDDGKVHLVGNLPERIQQAFEDVLSDQWPQGEDIPLWDGHAGERIGEILLSGVGK